MRQITSAIAIIIILLASTMPAAAQQGIDELKYLGELNPAPTPLRRAIQVALMSWDGRDRELWYATTSIDAAEAPGTWYASVAGLSTPENWNIADHMIQAVTVYLWTSELDNQVWGSVMERQPNGVLAAPVLLGIGTQQHVLGIEAETLSPSSVDAIPEPENVYTYIFPWQAGSNAYYGALGVHDAGFASYANGWKAVDFVSGFNWDDNAAPNGVYGIWTERIEWICRNAADASDSIAIKTERFIYAHLNNSSLAVGDQIEKGILFGSLKMGTFNEPCGYADQAADHWHLHLGFPNYGEIQFERCILDMDTEIFDCGGPSPDTYGVGEWIPATWTDDSGWSPPRSPETFWDWIVYGVVSMAFQVLGIFPESDSINLAVELARTARSAIAMVYILFRSNFNPFIPLTVLFTIAGLEAIRLVYATYRIVRKALPLPS